MKIIPLFSYAAGSGQKGILQWLLDHGADTKSIEQSILYARSAGRDKIAAFLTGALTRRNTSVIRP